MEGWTLAVCEYHKILIQLKHQSLALVYSEAILCPIFHESPLPGYFQGLSSVLSESDSERVLQIKPNTVRDFSCASLACSRMICAMVPLKPTFDQYIRVLRTGLEVCGSLGCSSVSLPVLKLDCSLEKSAELCLEGVELFILGQLGNPGCLKEISVCCQSSEELAALNQASRFRMTRYSSFICIGMPEELPDSQRYCYKCCSIYNVESYHEENNCLGVN